jgi:hypothetical protein
MPSSFDALGSGYSSRYALVGIFLLLAIASPVFAQGAPTGDLPAIPQDSSPPPHPTAPNDVGPDGSERVFGVVRTFGITDDKNAPPLTPRGKFRIFRQNVTDPFTFVGTAIQAGIEQASNDFPSYGQGMSGYAKRYGAAIADYAIGEFMSTYAFPSLLHEDPRYFREGEGSTRRRLGHAMASAFVTRTDSGRASFNWSNSVGRIAAGGVSTLYYPAEDRSVGLVFSRAGIGMLFGTAGAIFSEFGPDIERKLFKKKSAKQTPNSAASSIPVATND